MGYPWPRATGWVRDASGAEDVSIGDVNVWEPDAGRATIAIPVVLARPLDHDVVVSFETIAGTAPGAGTPPFTIPATVGQDFLARQGTVRLRAGQTSASIEIKILGDLVREAEYGEYFRVAITAVSGATYEPSAAVVYIQDDDLIP